jgi:hypothetical protein
MPASTETVFFGALKNLRQLEHVRHRPVSNFTINLMARIMLIPSSGCFLNRVSGSATGDFHSRFQMRKGNEFT